MSTIATDIIPAPAPHELQRGLGPSSVGDAPAIGGAEVWRIIKEQKVFITVLFTLLFLMAVAGTFAVAKWLPQYTAETFVELLPPRNEDMRDWNQVLVVPDILKLQLETEARKLKGLDILRSVLSLPEIKNTQYFKWYGSVEKALYELEEDVASTPIPDTQIIRVRFWCQDAEEARLIVNTVASTYESKFREQATQVYANNKDSLSATLAKIARDRDTLMKRITEFRSSVADLPQMETQRSSLSDQLTSLSNEVTLYRAHQAQLEGQLNAVRAIGSDLPVTPEMKIIVEADPVLRLWRQTTESISVEIATAISSGKLGEKHLTIRQMEARRRHYLELEQGKRAELLQDLRQRELENLTQSLASARNVLQAMGEDMADLQSRQRDMDAKYQQFMAMVQEETSLSDQHKQTSEALRQAEHALEDKSRIRLHVVQSAERPQTPSRPSWTVYLGGGFVVSLMIAFGLAFLREFTDNAIRTPVDVARHGRVSVLGTIPVLDDEEANVEQIEMATRSAPQSLVAEAFRQVRTNLLFSGPAESQRSLLVTSPSPGDGKTAIAINLAVSLARSNQRVLLIDCNFRRPAIRNTFANTRTDGLSNILVGQTTLSEVVTKTDMPNLDVLATGPMPPTPAELLGTRYMRELIAEAVSKYDRVVIDGPPVLLVSDALVLATQVDGVILVTRAVTNSKGALKRAREQLNKVNARVLGAVLNGVRMRPGGYFKRQYREFYDYTSDETIPRELPMTDEKTE